MNKSPDAVVDGRRQRSERNKAAIVHAALALIDEGVLLPTAQQVSSRAGVAMRTFFRHFDDMETLFTAIDEAARKKLSSFFTSKVSEGSLEVRINKVVEDRVNAYECIKNFVLSGQAHLWRSAYLQKRHAQDRRRLRRDLELRIPEIASLNKDEREFADAITSFEMWHRLRVLQGVGKKACAAQIAASLAHLLS